MSLVTFWRVSFKKWGSVGTQRAHLPATCVSSARVGGMTWAQPGTWPRLPNTLRVSAWLSLLSILGLSPSPHTRGCGEKVGKQTSGQAENPAVGRGGTGVRDLVGWRAVTSVTGRGKA